ncbi:hypothetical protein R3P38DRAFT_837317 [Favolaschia claudopus]|uniref:Uncharacterized protein n=1 Tax=Favolaschia claudopus TaxID=2862362 RepID=A0AAV9Z1V1_9AGAR
MDSFTFDSERITKSAILSARGNRSVHYTSNTSKNLFARQCTTVEDATGTIRGAIDWKERTFEIMGEGGKKESVDLLKRKDPSQTFATSTRFWRWSSQGEEYKVRYSNSTSTWIVTVLSTGELVSELTSTIERVFKSNTLPTWNISRDVRNETERLFILMVLLYSETKRLDRQD